MSKTQTSIANNSSDHFSNAMIVTDLQKMIMDNPDNLLTPDYHDAIDKHLNSIEQIAITVGKKETLSDEEIKELKCIAVRLFRSLPKIKEHIETIESLPEDKTWGNRVLAKWEHVAERTEDVAETCALATNKKFIETLKAEIRNIMDGPKDNKTHYEV